MHKVEGEAPTHQLKIETPKLCESRGTWSPREGEVRVEGGPHIQLKGENPNSRGEGDVRIRG